MHTQMVDALEDCEFEGHGAHVLAREAPAFAENVLTPQLIQALSATAPVLVRYLPAPQSVHAASPGAVLYFPATQAVHVPPFVPVNPGLQTQLACAVDPTTD